jgi:iron complex outermembrane recepter protein
MNVARAVAIALGLFGGAAHALGNSGPQREVRFDVPPQPLEKALTTFASQSDLGIVFYSRATAGINAPALSGSLTPEHALQILLSHSPLRYEFINDKTVAILAPDDSTSASQMRSTASVGSEDRYLRVADARGAQSPETSEPGTDSANSRAFTESGASAGRTRSNAGETGAASVVAPARGIPEILVQGTKTLNVDIQRTRDDARPYVVFDRESMQRSGAQNLEDFFRRNLTSIANGDSTSQVNSLLGGASKVDLGGLGTDETLILVDGRRMAGLYRSGAPNQPDVNGIPLSAIERIEVLRSTASGIYGGGATGGVVNIVMRRDYVGTEAKLTYEGTVDGGSARRRVDVAAGYSFNKGRTNLLAAVSYSNSNQLLIANRDLVQEGRTRVFENAPSTFYATPFSIPLGATTNISSTTGATLTLKPAYGSRSLGSSRTYVPYGYAGPGSDNAAGLVANAGGYNLDLANTAQADRGAQRSLTSAPEVKSGALTLNHELSPRIKAFMELSSSDNIVLNRSSSSAGFWTIPSTAPSNPFNESILVTVPITAVEQEFKTSIKSKRASLGFTAALFEDWTMGVDHTWNQVELANSERDFFYDASAISAMSDGTANVFRDVNAFPADFSFAVYDDVLTPEYLGKSWMNDSAARISGPLSLTLPAGPPVLSTSIEYRREVSDDVVSAETATSPTTVSRLLFPRVSQTTESAYLEVVLPIVSSKMAIPLADTLEIQVAGRYDNYRTIGGRSVPLDVNLQPTGEIVRRQNRLHSVDPAMALRFKPTPDVMFRGSFGTGFLPPPVNRLVPSRPDVRPQGTLASLAAFGLVDSARGGEPLSVSGPVVITSGGNADLRPEESRSVSAGLVLTPRIAPNLRMSVDWTRIKKRDAIVVLPLVTQGLIDLLNEAAPERITRATVASGIGPITALDISAINFSSSETEAFDLALDYSWDTPRFGRLTFSSNATDLVHSKSQTTPRSSVVENAGVVTPQLGSPKWRASAALSWDLRSWTTSWSTRYYGPYFLNAAHSVVAAQAAESVPSQIYHDISIKYDTTRAGIFSNISAQIGATNVLNKKPPFDSQSITGAYYSSLGDPRLATYYISVRKSLGY